MKITTNKENWSGEEITVVVNQKKRSFSLYGYDFTLEIKCDHSQSDYPMIIYNIMGSGWDEPLGVVCHDIATPDNVYWNERFEAFHGRIAEDSLSRSGKNIYEAAIKMLCNVI